MKSRGGMSECGGEWCGGAEASDADAVTVAVATVGVATMRCLMSCTRRTLRSRNSRCVRA